MESLSKMLEVEVASFAFAVALISTSIAGILDARRCTIPNQLTLGLIVLGLLFHLAMPSGRGWVFCCGGMAFGFAVLLPFFILGGIGAADVKLLTGIGAWVGIHDVMAIFLVFGTLMGVYSALLLLFSKREGRDGIGRTANHASSGQRIDEVLGQAPSERSRRVIPMAPAMAIAILLLAVTP